MGEKRTTATDADPQDARRAANAPVGDHPADNVAPPSNPDVEAEDVAKGEDKLGRLSTH